MLFSKGQKRFVPLVFSSVLEVFKGLCMKEFSSRLGAELLVDSRRLMSLQKLHSPVVSLAAMVLLPFNPVLTRWFSQRWPVSYCCSMKDKHLQVALVCYAYFLISETVCSLGKLWIWMSHDTATKLHHNLSVCFCHINLTMFCILKQQTCLQNPILY